MSIQVPEDADYYVDRGIDDVDTAISYAKDAIDKLRDALGAISNMEARLGAKDDEIRDLQEELERALEELDEWQTGRRFLVPNPPERK